MEPQNESNPTDVATEDLIEEVFTTWPTGAAVGGADSWRGVTSQVRAITAVVGAAPAAISETDLAVQPGDLAVGEREQGRAGR